MARAERLQSTGGDPVAAYGDARTTGPSPSTGRVGGDCGSADREPADLGFGDGFPDHRVPLRIQDLQRRHDHA